ncbi:MAG: hypothetical protein RIC55_12275 [Pirellulaceae bacterium]
MKSLGSLVIATCVGAFAQSWWVFALTAAVLIGLSIWDGGIRLRPRKR